MKPVAAVAGAAAVVATGAVGARVALRRATATTPEIRPVPEFERAVGDHHTVTTDDDAELAVVSMGDGPTIVLCHGWTADIRMWVAMTDRLRDAGFRVVLWDQRGHGNSTVGSSGFGVDRLGLDLAAVLTDLDLTDVIVLGHSMGGVGAQSLAVHAHDTVAERVAGFVFVSTLARNAVPPPVGGALVSLLRSPLFTSTRGRSPLIARFVARRSMGEPVTESMIDWSIRLFDDCPTDTVADALESLTDFDLRPEIRRITTPSIVVTGDRDTVVPSECSVEIDQLLARSRLHWLPDCGHQVPFERPDELVGVVVGLASDLDERFGVPGLRRSD